VYTFICICLGEHHDRLEAEILYFPRYSQEVLDGSYWLYTVYMRIFDVCHLCAYSIYHSFAWHVKFMCVSRRIHSWLITLCDMTLSESDRDTGMCRYFLGEKGVWRLVAKPRNIRKHGRFYWLLHSLQKRGVFVHKNSLALRHRCRHSEEARALTCPFKQSNLSAWSLLIWHPTHTYHWGRLCFIQVVCSPPSQSRRVTQIMSTEALFLNGFGWSGQGVNLGVGLGVGLAVGSPPLTSFDA